MTLIVTFYELVSQPSVTENMIKWDPSSLILVGETVTVVVPLEFKDVVMLTEGDES